MWLRNSTIDESGYGEDERIGRYRIIVNNRSKSVRARWSGPELRITVPPGIPRKELDRFIDRYADKLANLKPCPYYSIGMVIDTPEVDFSICRAYEEKHGDVFLTSVAKNPQRGKRKNYYIHVAPSVADSISDNTRIQEAVNRLVRLSARDATRRFLLPRAKEIAEAIGRKPLGWIVEDTKSRLGCCSSKGIISLSARLIFLPLELRDFIVYHELAHLSEMNHSVRFHEVCNSYCGGLEKELSSRLRKFKFPVFY